MLVRSACACAGGCFLFCFFPSVFTRSGATKQSCRLRPNGVDMYVSIYICAPARGLVPYWTQPPARSSAEMKLRFPRSEIVKPQIVNRESSAVRPTYYVCSIVTDILRVFFFSFPTYRWRYADIKRTYNPRKSDGPELRRKNNTKELILPPSKHGRHSATALSTLHPQWDACTYM